MKNILFLISVTLLLGSGVAPNANDGKLLAGNKSDLPFEHSVVLNA